MKITYPIIISKGKEYFIVYVPDFNINTQGTDTADAMKMARDAIGIVGIDMEDENEALPIPTDITTIKRANDSDIITLVDVDFTEYRRKNDMRAVKKNCTVPSWLCYEAEKAGINFSATLQAALKQELQLT
ncbi:MAG: type II toxin-antitoxin system HicB family antitoxin [Oscillospiraceae bacterium]|jgi:predicted RNase H-like HicB family nuclease|nr:type II toxin-antitoxin system HicB family antitoxin [Oscillospiraceae bacterium]